MFPVETFNLDDFIKQRTLHYGVPPRPFWLNTYYGDKVMKLVLKRFDSNIIFSNGLVDSYSQMSILESLSDTVVAVKAVKGEPYCSTLGHNKPGILTTMRKKEVKIIMTWVSTYNADLSTVLQRCKGASNYRYFATNYGISTFKCTRCKTLRK